MTTNRSYGIITSIVIASYKKNHFFNLWKHFKCSISEWLSGNVIKWISFKSMINKKRFGMKKNQYHDGMFRGKIEEARGMPGYLYSSTKVDDLMKSEK